jgi:hypothetical protein
LETPVQTFLPFPDYVQTALCLDRQRLGKQRVEVVQILNALHDVRKDENKPPGWVNHPATKMWRGFEVHLCEYGLTICEEWIKRGYKDEQKKKLEWHFEVATASTYTLDPPPWLGDEDFHRAHQSNLVRKDPGLYRRFFPGVPDNLEYIWPVA